MRVNAHFLKDSRNVWMKEVNISNISCYKVVIIIIIIIIIILNNIIIILVILHNCWPPCNGSIAYDFPAGTWGISGCHRQPPCYGWHLSEMHCKIIFGMDSTINKLF